MDLRGAVRCTPIVSKLRATIIYVHHWGFWSPAARRSLTYQWDKVLSVRREWPHVSMTLMGVEPIACLESTPLSGLGRVARCHPTAALAKFGDHVTCLVSL